MSTNPTEERLFLALDTIEKLTERAEQSQATIEKLQVTVAEQQRTIVIATDNKLAQIDTTYKHVNEVMFQGIYQAISKNIRPTIEDEVHQAIKNNIVRATAQNVAALVKVIDDAADLIQDTTTTKNGISSEILFDANQKLEEMTKKMNTFEKTLAFKHYLLITLFGGGLFLLMCLALFIFIKFAMPTAEENQKIRLENDALLKQRASLIQGNQQIRNN